MRLVKFQNRSGYIHDGCFAPAQRGELGIIAIHGSLQNFYGNRFTAVMGEMYPEEGISFLSFNLRCHDGVAEGEFSDGHVEYVGGSLSEFDSCVEDISAAVSWIRKRCNHVILQGHSLGCDRIVHYLRIKKENDIGIVLLGPCDSSALQAQYLNDRQISDQKRRMRRLAVKSHEFELLKPGEYGVRRGKSWTYAIPISAKALLSMIGGPPFELFNLSKPCSFKLENSALSLIGENDVLAPSDRSKMFAFLRNGFLSLNHGVVRGADHCFSGKERVLARRIGRWAKRWQSRVAKSKDESTFELR